MTDQTTQLYEGMFLFNIQAINGNLQEAVDQLNEILSRAEADVIALARWDERKLAYEIKGQKRGLYLLAHFKVRPSQVANIERDVNLSETLLRCLIIKAEHIGETELEAAKEEAAKLADFVKMSAEDAAPAGSSDDAPAEPAPVAAEAGDGDDGDENTTDDRDKATND